VPNAGVVGNNHVFGRLRSLQLRRLTAENLFPSSAVGVHHIDVINNVEWWKFYL